MFINLGSADGFDKGSMLDYVLDTTGAKKSDVGRIDIKGVYSFIEMEAAALPNALEAFKGEVFNGRKVRVDISGDGEKKNGSGNKKSESG